MAHTHCKWCSCKNCRFESYTCNMSQPHCPSLPPKFPATLKYILIYLIWTKTHLNPHLRLIRDCPSILGIYEGMRLSSAIFHTTALVFSLPPCSCTTSLPQDNPAPSFHSRCVLPNTARTKPWTELWHKPPLTIIQTLCCTRCETTGYTMHICDKMLDELQKFHPIIWGHSGCI